MESVERNDFEELGSIEIMVKNDGLKKRKMKMKDVEENNLDIIVEVKMKEI